MLADLVRAKPKLVGSAVLGCVGIVALAGFVILQVVRYWQTSKSDAARIRKELISEFDKIQPLPGSERVQYNSLFKIGNGAVSGEYRSSSPYEEIRSRYDAELARAGWKFEREEAVIFDEVDYGGKQAFYCKGLYTATLQYAGRQEEFFGWRYTFGLSWGLHDTQCVP